MASNSTWQQAWDRAQPRISYIRQSLSSEPRPRSRIIRVGQLDSELLDQELVQLLQEPVNKALTLINKPSLRARFEPELSFLIQLTLYKLSIWNIGASYGAKLQDLKYTAPLSPGLTLSPSGLPHRVLLIHGTLTVIIPYIHTRIRAHALSRAWPDAPSSDHRRKAWNILTSLESAHTLLGLLNFIVFLWDGRHRTVADRLLRMRLVPSQKLVKRDVSYEFMNRQMVWHAFTEFLIFLLPLVSPRAVRRFISRSTTQIGWFGLIQSQAKSFLGIKSSATEQTGNGKKRGKYWALSEDQCAICAENASYSLHLSDLPDSSTLSASTLPGNGMISPNSDEPISEPPTYPIYTPYITSCGHTYCYHCIADCMIRIADDGMDMSGWECLRCGEGVKGVNRVGSKVIPSHGMSETSGDEYDFSSDMDITDISGSVGSYSESGFSSD